MGSADLTLTKHMSGCRNAGKKALASLYPTLRPTSVTEAALLANNVLARSMRWLNW
jgi:hypothetical protein